MKKKGRNGYWKQEVKKVKVSYVNKITVALTIINGVFAIISFLAVRQTENVNINGVFSMLEGSNIGTIAIKNESNKYLSSLDYKVTFLVKMSITDDNSDTIYEQPIIVYSDPIDINDTGSTLGDIVNLSYNFMFDSKEYYSTGFLNKGKHYDVKLHPDSLSSIIDLQYKKVSMIPKFLNPFPDRKHIILKKGRKFINLSFEEYLELNDINDIYYIKNSIFTNYPNDWEDTLDKISINLENADLKKLKNLYKRKENMLNKAFDAYSTDYY